MTKNSEKFKSFLSKQDNLQLLFLCLAVVVMFASGKNLLDPLLLAQMFIPLLIFFAVLFFVAQIIGQTDELPKRTP